MTAAEIIRTLGMQRHPEGGWYVETFRDTNGSARGHSTAIYYLLEAGNRSHWHRVRDAVEIWHFHAGSPLRLSISDDGKTATHVRLELILKEASARKRLSRQMPGKQPNRWATIRWSAAPSLRASSLPRSKWLRLNGSRGRTNFVYSAGAGSGEARGFSMSRAASSAPPAMRRQASRMRQSGSAKPLRTRINVERSGAA